MSTKTIIWFLLALSIFLSFCDAVNFCQLKIKAKCRRPGKRGDIDDVMRAYDAMERRSDSFNPVIYPDDNLRQDDYYDKLYKNIAKKDEDNEYDPSETIIKNLLREYYEKYHRNDWEKRFY